MPKEIPSFYQTLANNEAQQELLKFINLKVAGDGLTREEYENVKHYIVVPGLDVEGFVGLNINHNIVGWTGLDNDRLIFLKGEKGNGDK